MIGLLKQLLQKVLNNYGYIIIRSGENSARKKYDDELAHWKRSLEDYHKWYHHRIPLLYGEQPPDENSRVTAYSDQANAVLTWQKIHQRPKYLEYLKLNRDAFQNKRILDLGSGPHPSALCFRDCSVYCLDPLLPEYLKAGFPFHLYDERARFTYGFGEKMPFSDDFFDAVISVNAIDHVDDFYATAQEVKRVLKPGGMLCMQIHFHKPTPTEPLSLSDQIVEEAFQWCPEFRKIDQTKKNRSETLTDPDEWFTLWRNF